MNLNQEKMNWKKTKNSFFTVPDQMKAVLQVWQHNTRI